MANKLSQLQLLLQRRVAVKRGVTDAAMLNATINELTHDLTHIISQWNSKLVPLLEALPDLSGTDNLDAWVNGLDGRYLFVHGDSTAIVEPDYYNATQNRPRSVFEQFVLLYTTISDLEAMVTDALASISFSADEITITDIADHFIALNVETALAELAVRIDNIIIGNLDLSAVDQDYLPVTDNLYDIGSSALRLAELNAAELNVASKIGDSVDSIDATYAVGVDISSISPGDFIVDAGSGPLFRLNGDVFSSEVPFKLPSLTQAEQDLLPLDDGLLIYNSDLNQFMGVENGAWGALRQGAPDGGSGWIYVADVYPQSTGEVNGYVYDDPGNDTIVESCTSTTLDITLELQASYPRFKVNGVESGTLLGYDTGLGLYIGTVNVTIAGTEDIIFQTITPNSADGAEDTVSIVYDAPPTILTMSFTGGYPGSQTQVKAGDTFQITGTTDVAADAVEIQGTGIRLTAQVITSGVSGTNFTVTVTVTQSSTSVVARAAQVRARKVGTTTGYGPIRATNELGGSTDGVDLINCCNLYPTVNIGTVTYPASQGALKDSETATVANTASDYNTILYTSPNSDLSIASDTTFQNPKTVQRIAGNYNVATTNFRVAATRAANNATTTQDEVVKIAHTVAAITVTEPAARLQSGGGNSTSVQQHTITISSDQQLYSAPTLDNETTYGQWQTSSTFSGGPSIWTNTLLVSDLTHVKGIGTWANLSATNLAGKETTAITGDDTYELGGFVARTLTFTPYSQTTELEAEVVTYAKLQAGVFTATNQPAELHSVQGNHADADNEFTVDQIGAYPTDLWWNDVDAAGSNSSGTAQITAVEETI